MYIVCLICLSDFIGYKRYAKSGVEFKSWIDNLTLSDVYNKARSAPSD